MIDIEKANKTFIDYVKNYDINNGRIRLKMTHILNVAKTSREIAIDLNLDEEDIELAELIGLFHDIGRFEQAKRFNTFSDKDSGVDHAKYGLKVLYEDGLIKKFIDTDEYDDIIKTAVYNHNKVKIDDSVSGRALLFSKIIRDADKLDIYRVIASKENAMIDIFWYKEFEGLSISDDLLEKFKKEHFVNYKDIKNNADLILAFYGYLYDFYYPYSLRTLKKKKYLEAFTIRVKETFKNDKLNKQVDELLDMCNNYIDEKIK